MGLPSRAHHQWRPVHHLPETDMHWVEAAAPASAMALPYGVWAWQLSKLA